MHPPHSPHSPDTPAGRYEITVTSVLCAAHALKLGDGTHEPMHGHNWQVRVTVGGEQLDEIETVMDFHQLQGLVSTVLAPANNGNLNEIAPFANGQVNPTAERVAWWLATTISGQLPDGVSLVRVCVSEAPGCEATYWA